MGQFEGLSFDPSGWSSLGFAGVLRFVVTGETLLTGWITAKGGFGWSPDVALVILRDDCDQVVGRSAAVDGKDVLPERYLAPGTYYAVVTGDYGARSYLGSLTARPAVPAAGQSCSAPIPLTWDAASGQVAIHGDTTGLHEWTRDACQDWNSEEYPQLVYRLDLPARSFVKLSGRPATLNIGTDCWAKLACYAGEIDYGSLGGKLPLDAGTYYVIARTQPPGAAFDLTGTILPWPTNESCQAASPIDLSSGTASIWGDTRYATGTQVACTSSSTVESRLVYAISTEGLGDRSLDVDLDVVYQPGSGQHAPSVVLQRACESSSAADVIACAPQSWSLLTSQLGVDVLSPGQYWLSVGDAAGPFDLTVTLGAPRYPLQPNDTCAAPTRLDLSLAPRTTTVSGDTRGAADSVAGACGGAEPGVGNDVVYEVVTGSRGRLDLRLTPAAGLDGVLRLGASCAAPVTACVSGAGANGAEDLGVKLQGSPTFVWVDGAAGTAGTFALSATYTPPPSNDICANAPFDATALGTPRTGDLRDAYPDATGACAAGEADLWYAYTNPSNSPQGVTFTIQPNGFDAVVRVVSDANGCATATCPSPVDSAGVGVAETTPSVSVKGGGTVLVQVTSKGGGGPFSIVANAQ